MKGAKAAHAERAVLIGIDGLPPAAIHAAIDRRLAPTLAALRNRAAYTDDARAQLPSLSLPNWASILTGAPVPFHGVHASAPDADVRPAAYADGVVYPNLFTAGREARAGLNTAAFLSWPPLESLLHPRSSLNTTVVRACSGCQKCQKVEERLVADFVRSWRASPPDLAWLYLDVLDECGHKIGSSNLEEYLPLVKLVDDWLARVMRVLHSHKGQAKRTAVMVVTDHGRESRRSGGRDHGGFTTDEMRVQWLIAGPGIRPGVLSWPVSTTDAAPTLLHALGIRPPQSMHGRVVTEAFEGADVGWAVRAIHTRNATELHASAASSGIIGHFSVAHVCGGLALVSAVLIALRRRARRGGLSTSFAPGYLEAPSR